MYTYFNQVLKMTALHYTLRKTKTALTFLRIFKYWILSYLQVHVFTILLKVFKGGERKKYNIIIFDQLILIYRANIGKKAILCQNIGHFKKDRDFIGYIGLLEGLPFLPSTKLTATI